jgi:hypothetical protein
VPFQTGKLKIFIELIGHAVIEAYRLLFLSLKLTSGDQYTPSGEIYAGTL